MFNQHKDILDSLLNEYEQIRKSFLTSWQQTESVPNSLTITQKIDHYQQLHAWYFDQSSRIHDQLNQLITMINNDDSQ